MNREDALERLLGAVSSWLDKPVQYDRIDGDARVWFNNEYSMRLPLAAVLILWPDAQEVDA